MQTRCTNFRLNTAKYYKSRPHLPRVAIASSLLGMAFVFRLKITLAVELNVTTATLVPIEELDIPNSSMIVLAKAIPFLKFVFPTLAELSNTNTRSRPPAPEDKPARAKLSVVLQLSLSMKCLRNFSATPFRLRRGSGGKATRSSMRRLSRKMATNKYFYRLGDLFGHAKTSKANEVNGN